MHSHPTLMPWVGLGVRPERLVADGRGWGKAAQVGATRFSSRGRPTYPAVMPFCCLAAIGVIPSLVGASSTRDGSCQPSLARDARTRCAPVVRRTGQGGGRSKLYCSAGHKQAAYRAAKSQARLWGSRPGLDRLLPVRPLEQSLLTVGSCLRTVNRRRYGRGARRSRAATRARRRGRTPRRTGSPSRSRSRGWPSRRRAAGRRRPRRADAATAASA